MNKTAIIKTHEIDHYPQSLPYPEMVGAKTKYAVWAGEDMVRLTISNQYTGINRSSGNRFYRWNTDKIVGLRRISNGNVVPYAMSSAKPGSRRKVHVNAEQSFAFLRVSHYDPVPVISEAYRDAAKSVLGVSSLYDVYPVVDNYEIDMYVKIPADIRRMFRATDARQFTEQVFGKKQYRKDLLKSTAQLNSPAVLSIARNFTGLVPVDWIVNFLRINEYADVEFNWRWDSAANLRNILRRMDPRSYRHLLNQRVDEGYPRQFAMVLDTCRLYGGRGMDNRLADGLYVRNFTEMHDQLVGHRAYEPVAFEDKEIALTPMAQKLDGMAAGRYTIYPAHHSSEMLEWGQEMRNCIAGYRKTAIDGKGVYGAVMDQDKMIANFEIRNNDLIQLLGKCNLSLPDPTRKALEKAFHGAGVNVDNYWGK